MKRPGTVLKPVMLATQKVEIGRMEVQA
jgi:hypothetical protein